MAAAPPPAKAYHHGDLRHAMLDAVAEVVREHGLAQVSLREVARRVGVSHSAAIHHFGNKAGLLTTFAAQGYVDMAESVLASISEEGGRPIGTSMIRFSTHGSTIVPSCWPDWLKRVRVFGKLRSSRW